MSGTVGLDDADDSFRAICHGTSRLVQLLTDEIVPLADQVIEELVTIIEGLRHQIPALANWRGPSTSTAGWTLEPPFAALAVQLNEPSDFLDYENVERLRRSFEFLEPNSLALRKEPASMMADALLELLRRRP